MLENPYKENTVMGQKYSSFPTLFSLALYPGSSCLGKAGFILDCTCGA